MIRLSSPAKINVGLFLSPPDPGGYHPLQSLFVRVTLEDLIEIEVGKPVGLDCDSSGIPTDESNLVLKAYRIFCLHYPQTPSCAFYLHKHIPTEAGLGGGSANAGAVLQWLFMAFAPSTPKKSILEISFSVGADVPFFTRGCNAFVTGYGEKLHPVLPLSSLPLLLVKPYFSMPTAQAYREFDRLGHPSPQEFPLAQVVHDWNTNQGCNLKNLAPNHFQEVAVSLYPQAADLVEDILDNGAVYASMSGSGSVFFGIFANETSRNKAAVALRSRWPWVECAKSLP